jgi:hypothetical protein
MTAAPWIATHRRSSAISSEVVFGEFTGRQAPKEFCADAPDWIAESECRMRAGATTVADRS